LSLANDTRVVCREENGNHSRRLRRSILDRARRTLETPVEAFDFCLVFSNVNQILVGYNTKHSMKSKHIHRSVAEYGARTSKEGQKTRFKWGRNVQVLFLPSANFKWLIIGHTFLLLVLMGTLVM